MLVLVFSLECLIRSFAKTDFPPRGGNTLIFCISSTTALTAMMCLFLRFSKADNGICNGHLLLFVNQYALSGLGLTGALIPIWAAILIGLWSNLENNTDIPVEQRIAAIKTGAYTILAALQMACCPRNVLFTHRKGINIPLGFRPPIFCNSHCEYSEQGNLVYRRDCTQ